VSVLTRPDCDWPHGEMEAQQGRLICFKTFLTSSVSSGLQPAWEGRRPSFNSWMNSSQFAYLINKPPASSHPFVIHFMEIWIQNVIHLNHN